MLSALNLFLACIVTIEEATETCYNSCETQKEDCETINLEECHHLCDWAVGMVEDDPTCLRLNVDRWECDQNIQWECSDDTEIVGQPIENLCQKEINAFNDAGCNQIEE